LTKLLTIVQTRHPVVNIAGIWSQSRCLSTIRSLSCLGLTGKRLGLGAQGLGLRPLGSTHISINILKVLETRMTFSSLIDCIKIAKSHNKSPLPLTDPHNALLHDHRAVHRCRWSV